MYRVDWNGELNSGDCNKDFERFTMLVSQTIEMVAPRKIVRISEKRSFVEPWMTTGIEEASKKKLRLYKKSIMATAT